MTRNESINQIKATLDELTDERISQLAQLAMIWTQPSVYSTLNDAQKAQVDVAIDEADRGDVASWDIVSNELEEKLRKAGG